MSWNEVMEIIVITLIAIIPGIIYPYLQDCAEQKRRELEEENNEQHH